MADRKLAAEKKATAEKKAAADKKATAEKKAAAERKLAAEKKAAADKKLVPANRKLATKKTKTVSEKRREDRQEFVKISVYVDTGKILGIVSLGVFASAVLITALAFFIS